jgi:hypothetical protein
LGRSHLREGQARHIVRGILIATLLRVRLFLKADCTDGCTKISKYWVRNVKTVSTFPPNGTFTKDATTIARIMASKKVSPKGIGTLK